MALQQAVEEAFKLPHPPIVEAVVDVDCDLPTGFELAAFEERALAIFRNHYPTLRKQFLEEHHLERKDAEPPTISSKIGLQALQFVQLDGLQLVQVRHQGFSFNRLAPYSSLDDYMPEIERA